MGIFDTIVFLAFFLGFALGIAAMGILGRMGGKQE
jgi:hypothetical protein